MGLPCVEEFLYGRQKRAWDALSHLGFNMLQLVCAIGDRALFWMNYVGTFNSCRSQTFGLRKHLRVVRLLQCATGA